MSLETCLEHVVGLSQTICDCWDTDKPVDFNTSLSGLYVSDLVPIETTQSAADCERGGVWDLMQTARANAIKTFLADLPANLSLRNENRFNNFKGFAGSARFNSSLVTLTPGSFLGLTIKPYNIKGGKIVLDGIELALDNIATPLAVDVYVYSSVDLYTPIATTTVNLTDANTLTPADFAVPLVIDCGNTDAQGYTTNDPDLEYYVVYQLPANARYVNNPIIEAKTACCGRAKTVAGRDSYPWLSYMEMSGIESPAVADLFAAPRNTTTAANGLRLKMQTYCDGLGWLCGLSYDPNGANYAEYSRGVAYCLQQLIAAELCKLILQSGNINSMIIWSKERLMGMANHYKKNYMETALWVAANYPPNLVDCYSCKKTMSKQTLKI